MKVNRIGKVALAALSFSLVAAGAWASAPPLVQKNCMKCHEKLVKMKNVLAGNLSSKSLQSKTLQIKIGDRLELVRFNAKTKIKNIPKMEALEAMVALRVHYEMDGADKVATKVVVKPEIKVPDKQLMKTAELTKLLAKGPVHGRYTLIDSRPPEGFAKGHIPTAISIPFPRMKEMRDKLPKDKNRLIIFYCQGYR